MLMLLNNSSVNHSIIYPRWMNDALL